MRACSLILFAFAASCTSNAGPDYSIPSTTVPDAILNMSCRDSVANVCAAGHCDDTLEEAEHDAALCSPGFPGVLVVCGDYDVVAKSETDTARQFFYRDGRLTAILSRVDVLPTACMAGPTNPQLPLCNSPASAPLAACH